MKQTARWEISITDLVAAGAGSTEGGPRDPLGVAALRRLAEVWEPQSAPSMAGSDIAPVQRNRLRRVAGGRPCQVIVRLTIDEHVALQSRAADANVSVQRYLLEAGLSGKSADGAARRRAERELMATRGVLRAAGNNLNQLAKWANANSALPSHLEPILASVAVATSALAERVEQLAATLEGPL